MKKFKIIISFFLVLLFFNSCGTIKKGFQNPKKNSSDEFLVEKKSPLIMPPEFNELPIPSNQNTNNIKKNSIKNMIGEKSPDKNKNITSKDIEGSIIDKIKTE